MYQPISFNVIRQALAWHGFPLPELRILSISPVNEDGIVTAEYLARWSYSLIDEAVPPMLINGERHETDLVYAIQKCFCDDVQVRQMRADDIAREYRCLLYVRVDQSVTVLSDWLNRQYN